MRHHTCRQGIVFRWTCCLLRRDRKQYPEYWRTYKLPRWNSGGSPPTRRCAWQGRCGDRADRKWAARPWMFQRGQQSTPFGVRCVGVIGRKGFVGEIAEALLLAAGTASKSKREDKFRLEQIVRLQRQLRARSKRAAAQRDRRKRIHDLVRELQDRNHLASLRDSAGVHHTGLKKKWPLCCGTTGQTSCRGVGGLERIASTI